MPPAASSSSSRLLPSSPSGTGSGSWADVLPVEVLKAGLAFAALTALAIAVLDAPLARFLGQWEPPAFWGKLLELLEWPAGLQLEKRVYLIGPDFLGPIELNVTRWAYALGLGAIALVTLIVPRLRGAARAWCFVALAHLLSRLAMVELKESTGRLRPSEWLAAGGGPTFFREGGLSFPSGHVTYFLSLLLPLAIVAPRLRRPALAVVALVAACRVAQNAHFASDVTGAVALVCFICFALAALLPPWRWRGA
jgi:membrane-associated phospholipid phosphatase